MGDCISCHSDDHAVLGDGLARTTARLAALGFELNALRYRHGRRGGHPRKYPRSSHRQDLDRENDGAGKWRAPGHTAGKLARTCRIGLIAAGLVFATVQQASAAGPPLPVPRITIYPGDAIRADHLVDRVFHSRVSASGAVHRARDGLVGKVARRTLLPGEPIPVNAVRDPFLVLQGRTVQIVFQEGGLTITGYAVALQSGGMGEVVSVRNVDSGIIVKGAVLADGTVHVGDP